MKSTRAVFTKQAKDLLRNPAVLMQYIIFPAVAFLMTELVAKPNPDIPANMFVCMMASIFAGMALISSAAHAIAEDMEKKSLRFLVMAGVKPHQYLIGTGGFILIAGAVVSVAFAAIGGFEGADLAKFLLVMIAGVAASTLLGSLIGILAKNQQAATAVGTPIAIILGFTPMIATFNESIEKVAGVLYTQQLNVITNDFDANFTKAMAVIGVNIAIFAVLFAIAYRKRGLAV